MGHEYCGIVEEVGSEVKNIKPGQFVVGSFFASDNTCPICRAGYQTSCVQRQPGAPTGAQAEYARIPLADGTLVADAGPAPRRPDPQPAGGLRRARHRLVCRRRGQRQARQDGRGGRRRRGRPPRRALGQADGRRADHRDEPPRVPPEARPRVRRDRHRDRARRRGRGADQGTDRRARRALGHRGRRHAGVDDAGHPRHAARRSRRVRRRAPRRGRSPAGSTSSRTCTCTAAPRRCAATCPS